MVEKENRASENASEVNGEEIRREESAGSSLQEPMRKKESQQKKRSKRKALIFLTVVLVLLAVTVPLITVNYDRLFEKVTGREKEEIVYYPADYDENIFENEEYMSHKGGDMTVSVNGDGIGTYSYPFSDLASAEKAFGMLSDYENGAGVLGEYFYALLKGCTTPADLEAFCRLFAEEYRENLPHRFPPQKVFNIRLTYGGKYEHEGRQTDRWRVEYEVVRNDGTVLNFNDSRDGGEAWFLLVETLNGEYEIVHVSGIRYMN